MNAGPTGENCTVWPKLYVYDSTSYLVFPVYYFHSAFISVFLCSGFHSHPTGGSTQVSKKGLRLSTFSLPVKHSHRLLPHRTAKMKVVEPLELHSY